LRASQHKLSRRIQWHQVLLFLLRRRSSPRSSLALAKPIFSKIGGRIAHGAICHSRMSKPQHALRQPGGDTPFVLCEEDWRRLA